MQLISNRLQNHVITTINCCCFSIMCQDFRHLGIAQSSERLDFDSRVYVTKIVFNSNSQGDEKFELFS